VLIAFAALLLCAAPQSPKKPTPPKKTAPAPELALPAAKAPEGLVPAGALDLVRAKSADDFVRVIDP
jgi:hypothetical protein